MAPFNLFMVNIILFSTFTTSFFLLIFHRKRNTTESQEETTEPTYSVLIPAYNEEENIAKCIDSVLCQGYPREKVEIYVIDDGSTDRTKEICEEYADKDKINLISKEHEGKVPSVNKVLKNIETDLFCVLDADTFFHNKKILRKIGSYFKNEDVAACLTTLEIKKSTNWVEKIQLIEYYLSAFMRKVMSFFNGLYTTHGASFYRTSAVKEVGLFDESNLVEDMEMTLRLIDQGYEIKSDLKTISYTIPPDNFKDLLKQRLRWYTGFMENLRDYKHMLFNKKYAGVGMISFPLAVTWMTILVILLFWFGFNSISGNILRFQMLSETNWDILFYLKTMFGPLRIGIYDIITVIGVALNILVAYLSYRFIRGTKQMEFSLNYIYYYFLFGFMQGFFWLASFINFLLPRKKVPWTEKT